MRMTKNNVLLKLIPIAVVIIGLVAWLAVTSFAQRKQTVGKVWPEVQRTSINEIDHQQYQLLLKHYVDDDGLVDYKSWHSSSKDRSALRQYLAELSRADLAKPTTQEAKLSFWINAYNALTLDAILDVYPTTSIRNHTSNLGGYNIWKHHLLVVGDREFSLDNIEHEVLRKMNEPRIHFAIVCASIGCPRLLNEAYTPEKIQRQLEANAKDFFSRPRNLSIDTQTKQIKLSSIMSWFGDDFGKTREDQLRYISNYFPDSAKAVSRDGFLVGFQDYDWNLNSKN